MKQVLTLPVVLLILISCGSDQTQDNRDITFFPIAGNINAELRALDSLPLGINKYITTGDRTDTTVATLQELKAVAGQLTNPDISDPSIKNYYKETVFYDKASDHLTMSYAATSEKPVVRKIEVMIRQETEQVRSIYVEKREEKKDTVFNRRMVWSPGRSLQVTEIATYKGKENVSTTRYSWGIE